MNTGASIMKDKNLKYVDEEVRRLMREFGDLIFDQADQGVVDSKWAETRWSPACSSFLNVRSTKFRGSRSQLSAPNALDMGTFRRQT